MGLDAMELEFVHSVWLTAAKAPQLKAVATTRDVLLSAHAPYYINLFSRDLAKREASKQRIVHAAKRCAEAGGWSVTFHPAFYVGASSETVSAAVIEALKEVEATLKQHSIDIWVRPETTGKPTQFGTFEEIIKISQQLERVAPCIDFSHIHARTNGKYNTYEEFAKILTALEDGLGKEALKNMHIHTGGIAYGEKGEKHHLMLSEADLRYQELCKAWKDFKIAGVVICESPIMEHDALVLQRAYREIR
jgi:deoxyribonuclease-4